MSEPLDLNQTQALTDSLCDLIGGIRSDIAALAVALVFLTLLDDDVARARALLNQGLDIAARTVGDDNVTREAVH
jgi:hypothetical protein